MFNCKKKKTKKMTNRVFYHKNIKYMKKLSNTNINFIEIITIVFVITKL